MTPFSPSRLTADHDFEDRMERAVFQAEDLYDLDGETFFRRRNGEVETGSWEAAI